MRTLVVNGLRMGGERTAIGRHIEHLAQQWTRIDTPFDKVVVMGREKLSIEGLGSRTPMEFRLLGGNLPALLWEQWALPRAAEGAAVVLCFYTCPLFGRGSVVVSNHGIYEAIPRTFSWWRRMRATPMNRASARRANRLIANSFSTKADIVRFFGVAESKIDVVYPGPADLFFESHTEGSVVGEVTRVLGRRVPYVMFVGKLATRRNVPNLMEAFSIVRKKEDLPHHLLMIGPNVNNLALQDMAARWGIDHATTYIPHMEHRQLARLYAGADIFVLPSIYEGLSRTMFEAMASGTAVLTVDHPALAEGGGDAVLSMPTPCVQHLVEGMCKLLTDRSLRAMYEQRGRAQVARFSMFECARTTMEVLDRAALPSDRGPV